jgi:hypothetical protein
MSSNRSKLHSYSLNKNYKQNFRPTNNNNGKLLSVPDNWADFARICTIRSGDGLIKFDPYAYQEKLIEQIQTHTTTIITKTRQLGLTETVTNYFLYKAIKNPGYLAVIFSKSQSDTSNIAKRLRRTIEYLYKYCSVMTDSLTDLEFVNGGRILFRNSTPNGARGLESVSDLLFDESSFVTDIEEIYKSAIPCTTVMGDKARIIILSTPNGQSGWYWDRISSNNGNKNILDICEQIKNEKISPTQYWTNEKGWSVFITHWLDHPKFKLQKETYLENLQDQFGLTKEIVDQEYNLSFVNAATTVFDDELIKRANFGAWEREIDYNASYYIGIDTSLQGTDYTVAIVLKSSGEKFYLVDMYRARKKANEVNLYNFSKLIQKYNPVAVGIEVNSGGQLYYEKLCGENSGTNIDAIKTTGSSKPVMINRLLLTLERNMLILPNDSIVTNEFQSFRNNEGKLEALTGQNDDVIMAISFGLTVASSSFS